MLADLFQESAGEVKEKKKKKGKSDKNIESQLILI
jgi:hypothetical protein